MSIDPKTIKPAQRGQSDFFSWQLYRWVRQNQHLCSVFAGTWNSVTGVEPGRTVPYIGRMDEDGWFHGTLLRGLCCHGASLQSWAYGPGHDTANWKDITAEFWTDYFNRGVCAVHGDLAHNWDYVTADFRVCRWCGKQEQEQTVYRAVKVWEQEVKAA